MVDLREFLGALGLPQYTKLFVDNDIDGAALMELQETHLKELGVSLGRRIPTVESGYARAVGGAKAVGRATRRYWL